MNALCLLILLGVDWASGYAIAGYCMTHGVNPYGYAFWQAFGPFILLLVIQLIRRDCWLERRGVVYALLCSIFGIVLPNLLIYLAAEHVPSGLLTVLANLSPIFTYILAVILKDEHFSWRRALWVSIGLLGVGFLIIPKQPAFSFAGHGIWLYIALLIPLSYAFSAVYISRFHPQQGNVLTYALWMLMFASLAISPLTVIKQGYHPLHFDQLTSYLIIGEILLSSFGYVLLFIILKRVGAVYYTVVNAVAALTGVAYGYGLFNQVFSRWTYGGIGLVVLAIAGLTYSQNLVRELRKADVKI